MKSKKREHAELVVGLAWIVLLFLVTFDLNVFSTTSEPGLQYHSSNATLSNIINNVQLKPMFYAAVSLIAFVLWYKHDEITNWLEINAPF